MSVEIKIKPDTVVLRPRIDQKENFDESEKLRFKNVQSAVYSIVVECNSKEKTVVLEDLCSRTRTKTSIYDILAMNDGFEQLNIGDRALCMYSTENYYDMRWGTIEAVPYPCTQSLNSML